MRAGDEFTPDDRAKLAAIGGARLVEAVNKGLDDVRERYWKQGLEAPPGTVFIRLQAELAAASGLVASLSELEEVYLKERNSRQRALPGAVELLAQLRARGIKVGVVSNSVFSREPMHAHLRQIGLTEHLDAVVYSSDVGSRKPQPKPYLAALAQMGCAPKNAVFVGDSPEADLAGAIGAGMPAIWLWGHNEAVGHLAAAAEPGPAPGVWPDLSGLPELRSLIEGLATVGLAAGAAAGAASGMASGMASIATAGADTEAGSGSATRRAKLVGAAQHHKELGALLLDK